MISEGLEKLAALDYPGRGIIIGANKDNVPVAAYFLTGRSPSSQNRKLNKNRVPGHFSITVDKYDETIPAVGEDLLFYTAVRYHSSWTIMTNGRHTDNLWEQMYRSDISSAANFAEAQALWEPEPDSTQTPRIAGYLTERRRAGLGIVRAGSAGTERDIFTFPLEAARGRLITTYKGINQKLPPAFEGEPHKIGLPGVSPQETAQLVYDALNPNLRIGVVVLYHSQGTTVPVIAIVNKHE